MSWASAHSRLVGSLAFRARLGDVVVGLAERAASTATCQPWVNAAGMERMAAGQSSYIVVVLQSIQADGARVARLSQHLGRSSSTDRVVLVVRLVLVPVNRSNILACRIHSLRFRNRYLLFLAILQGAPVDGRFCRFGW
jgi:hypothetical protein